MLSRVILPDIYFFIHWPLAYAKVDACYGLLVRRDFILIELSLVQSFFGCCDDTTEGYFCPLCFL